MKMYLQILLLLQLVLSAHFGSGFPLPSNDDEAGRLGDDVQHPSINRRVKSIPLMERSENIVNASRTLPSRFKRSGKKCNFKCNKVMTESSLYKCPYPPSGCAKDVIVVKVNRDELNKCTLKKQRCQEWNRRHQHGRPLHSKKDRSPSNKHL